MPNEQLPMFGLTPEELPDIANCECPNCGGEFLHDEGYDVGGDHHCPDCVIHCEECDSAYVDGADEIGEAYVGWHYRTRTNITRILCDDCAFTCADCSERFDAGGDTYENSSSDRICERCAENYYTCDDCGCVIHADDTRGNDDGTYCSDCFRESDEDGIYSHEYKPSPEFHAAQGELTTARNVFYGVEIEVEGGSDASIVNHDAFYCKRDGSLDDGFEIVSHPCTFKWWASQPLDFLPRLSRAGYRSYDTETCGLHIHVSRDAFTTAEIARLAKFFRNSADFIFKVSRRRSREAMNQWARIDSNDDAHLERKVNNRYDCFRYEALNLSCAHTLEFRLFRGTINVSAVKRNIAFTHTLCQYAKTTGLLNAQAYVEWLRSGKAVELVGEELGTALVTWLSGLL